jgi:hypothetical protein
LLLGLPGYSFLIFREGKELPNKVEAAGGGLSKVVLDDILHFLIDPACCGAPLIY